MNSSGVLFSISPAQWALGLVPPENINGRTRFTFAVYDGELYSQSVTAPIWVRPINDAPVIVTAEVISNADGEAFGFNFDVTDVDFKFKTVRINLNDLSGNGTFYVQGRNLTDSPSADYPVLPTYPIFLLNPSLLEIAHPQQPVVTLSLQFIECYVF